KRSRRTLFVSSISVAETLALPNVSPQEEKRIAIFLDTLLEIPFNNRIAKIAAFFKRYYKLTLPDSAIAASSFVSKLPLVTRDLQFYKISEITVVEI
ncbi:MAG: PIN domain-containing protein, partial [Candidatus Colwellbacteria bacterium]|nr:PIN domain-containing protein [Candidatus Colwellbacteria bacterium]